MNSGDKIKALRLARGLTLEEVGSFVGVGKSTVRKWETGAIANMRRDKIAKLAEILHTTPMEIIGIYEEDEKGNTAPALSLTADETQLVEDYRSLNPEGQTAARTMMAGLTAQPIYKKHHDPAELLDAGSRA